ncbi:MAG: hypothetical protein MK096_14995 [Oleiphilaceae bacterium]|nr:hypothetical protein [Oleiphilaceae bacterium]
MKRILIAVLALLPVLAFATDINCKGNVTWVMDYPGQCDGNTAFKTSGSNGKWICPASDKGNAIVLTALAAGKTVHVYIDSVNGSFTCGTLPHYVKARYVIIDP